MSIENKYDIFRRRSWGSALNGAESWERVNHIALKRAKGTEVMRMVVHLYGKEGCGKCDAAKDKLSRMGIDYKVHNLGYHVAHHDGWREDGSVDLLAVYTEKNDMPLLRVGEEVLDYSGAMKVLKSMRKKD